MTKALKTTTTLKCAIVGALLSSSMVIAAPAHAGLLDSLKKIAEKELTKVAQSAAEGAMESTFKVEKGTRENQSEGGFRQEGHTTVPTADDVQAPQRPQRAKLTQNGTTVATASEVQAPQRPQRAKLTQIGTTVATASEVQAPQRPQRAKLTQNGTTVATASEVQAPQRPQRSKMTQNGTTVATASEVDSGMGTGELAGDEHEIEYDVAAGVDRAPLKKVEAKPQTRNK